MKMRSKIQVLLSGNPEIQTYERTFEPSIPSTTEQLERIYLDKLGKGQDRWVEIETDEGSWHIRQSEVAAFKVDVEHLK
jgi:hypothetical protein